MSILNNAIDSIAIGLEDFELYDETRALSSVRNVFSGILLLFKHKLCEMSPSGSGEVLIKQNILPVLNKDGSLSWVGKGNKTVDVHSIKERFESLGVTVDWVRFNKINSYRNNIEHYYSTETHKDVDELISDSFIIIKDFISEELNSDPKSLLGEKSWGILNHSYEVYTKEQHECTSSIEALSYFGESILDAIKNYYCEECESDLIEATQESGPAVDSDFKCRSCEFIYSYEGIVDQAVVSHFYEKAIKSGITQIVNCSLCFDGIYIYKDAVCSTCGNS